MGDDGQAILRPQRQRCFEFYRMIGVHVEREPLAHDVGHQHLSISAKLCPMQIRRPAPNRAAGAAMTQTYE